MLEDTTTQTTSIQHCLCIVHPLVSALWVAKGTEEHVHRLLSQGTIEEGIVQRAKKKLYLDKMVNRDSAAAAQLMSFRDRCC